MAGPALLAHGGAGEGEEVVLLLVQHLLVHDLQALERLGLFRGGGGVDRGLRLLRRRAAGSCLMGFMFGIRVYSVWGLGLRVKRRVVNTR